MKRCVLALGLVLLATPSVFSSERTVLARVTVYWASGGAGSDNWTRHHRAATSIRLRAGHCAVDPRRIPYGSKVVIAETTCVAVDTGKHVVSRKAARVAGRTPQERNALVVDRFFETKSQALAWAGAHPHFMMVRVLSPNDPADQGAMPRTVAAASARPKLLRENSEAAGFAQTGALASHARFIRPASYLP
jgi:3D (Asp-Asp-Asp) domain-containing protein